jgi:hypothetical protein
MLRLAFVSLLNLEGLQRLAGGQGAARRYHRTTVRNQFASRRDASPNAMPLVISAAIEMKRGIKTIAATCRGRLGLVIDPGVALVFRATPGYRLPSRWDMTAPSRSFGMTQAEACRRKTATGDLEPGGFPALSRWLRSSAMIPPDHRPQSICIPEGCQT